MLFSESFILQTQRLALRKPGIEDIDALFKIFGDPRTNTFNPAGPYRDRSNAEITMERWLTHWKRHGFGEWAICLKASPTEIIGFGGLSYSMFGKHERINLGYRFATRAWGQGIATELAETAVHAGFRILHLREILATVPENHRASRRVLEKAGLRKIRVVHMARSGPANVIYEIRHMGLEIQA